ncbi:hypothetical protein NL676_028125 [Syzygium grande]|nr:hypothetical protein NL676_028125 [Syzygium grande]
MVRIVVENGNRAPNPREGARHVRHEAPLSIDSGLRSDRNGESLSIPGLKSIFISSTASRPFTVVGED